VWQPRPLSPAEIRGDRLVEAHTLSQNVIGATSPRVLGASGRHRARPPDATTTAGRPLRSWRGSATSRPTLSIFTAGLGPTYMMDHESQRRNWRANARHHTISRRPLHNARTSRCADKPAQPVASQNSDIKLRDPDFFVGDRSVWAAGDSPTTLISTSATCSNRRPRRMRATQPCGVAPRAPGKGRITSTPDCTAASGPVEKLIGLTGRRGFHQHRSPPIRRIDLLSACRRGGGGGGGGGGWGGGCLVGLATP